jgi:virulence-associated protein VagC
MRRFFYKLKFKTMKKIFLQFSLLVGLMLMLTACPYTSENPIDKATVKIDDKILGKWEAKSSSDYAYNVTKKDEFTYSIEKKSASSGEVTGYEGFLSVIDNVRFLNVYETSATTKTYYFYKVEMTTSGSKLTLAPVTENIDEKFASSEEIKAFFKKNMAMSFFFDKDEDVYIKAD